MTSVRAWLDNITRGLLTSGTLRHYIGDLAVTGLTSNPSIFDLAVKNSNFYDDAIRQKSGEGKSGEAKAATTVSASPLAADRQREGAESFAFLDSLYPLLYSSPQTRRL